ncbi:MAG: hypothetical protein H6822_34520 [Planctomycetaceae bacterium]|nr:hypothetical protein [Planctomycetales bacterium]MCB9927302.1 hypothetical protein [Planctomycetaceae bacterium]
MSRVTLWSCEDTNYLTVENVDYSTDGNGNPKEKVAPLVRHLAITPKQVQCIHSYGDDLLDADDDDDAV